MGPKPQCENPVPGKAGLPQRQGWRKGSDRFVYTLRSFQIVPRGGAGGGRLVCWEELEEDQYGEELVTKEPGAGLGSQ